MASGVATCVCTGRRTRHGIRARAAVDSRRRLRHRHAGSGRRICRRFARELGITVAAVDYRLAPEYPYPIPLEDCYARAHLAGRPARGRPRPGRHRRAQAQAAGWPRRWRCWPATAAKSPSPHRFWSTRCSTTGRRRGTDIDDSGHRLWTQTVERLRLVELPRRRRPERRRARPPRRPRAACRPRGSASAPTTCSTTRTSPTPSV